MNTPEPMTPNAEAFAQLHESFLMMVDAGFTDGQACRILGAMLAAAQAPEDGQP